VFSVGLGWFPSYGAVSGQGAVGLAHVGEILRRAVLPIATLTIAGIGPMYLVARSALVGELQEDYVLMAEAKGLSDREVRHHAARNALLPVSTVALVGLGSVRTLDESSAIGVVLAGSFALGVLVLSSRPGASRDLSAFLVGQILTVTTGDLVATIVVGTVVVVVLAALHKELIHGAFDPEGLRALGYGGRTLDLVVLVVVTVALVTAVPAVGTLLAVALLTVPALAARQWVERVGPMMALAAALGAGCGLVGLCLSAAFDVAAGGAIALTAAGVFVISALLRSPASPLTRGRRVEAAA